MARKIREKDETAAGVSADPASFRFRGLHPNVMIGTASDRYAGWIGQIYTGERYEGKIKRRRKTTGGKSFTEEVLPVESVSEYFEHFDVLEIDATFYRPLLDAGGKQTTNFHLLETYRRHLGGNDTLLLKVPELVFAPRIRMGGKFGENPSYLDPDVFVERFYRPANEILGKALSGFIFEQAYQRKNARPPTEELAASLGRFFGSLPADDRYHVEIRTEALLTGEVIDVLRSRGVGQVLSHWTWLPPLLEQFGKAGDLFLTAGNTSVVRLLTPRGVRYEDTYEMAHPFNAMVDGMLSEQMVEECVELIERAIDQGVRIDVIINNRAGGNAPLIAQVIALRFTGTGSSPSGSR